tara:strand:- start:532 stop:804 length:273 start_codon:yes stop_codon:yes gene_type:complete
MNDYSIDQLMLFIGGVASSIVLILLACQKSKCEEIGCCGCKIKRNVEAVLAEEKLKLTGHTGTTPKINTKDLKLELKEPENENENENEDN